MDKSEDKNRLDKLYKQLLEKIYKAFKSTSRTPFTLEPIGNNQTRVTWTTFGKMNYPMNIALLFINMDNFLGEDVEKSLKNLKLKLENRFL